MSSRGNRVAEIAARRDAALGRQERQLVGGVVVRSTADPYAVKLVIERDWLDAGKPFEVPLLTMVGSNLWVGGVVEGLLLPPRFRHVVSLHPWTPYAIAHPVTYTAFPMADSDELPDLRLLEALAVWVNACRDDGPTLVHCSAGLNRSALVAGLVLIRSGASPRDTVARLRERRHPHVLCNPVFAAWLEGLGDDPA